MFCHPHFFSFFFFNDTATTEIYTLSLHDALPISGRRSRTLRSGVGPRPIPPQPRACRSRHPRSEEHTSELQSRSDLVCRLLLEKKKKMTNQRNKRIMHTYDNTIASSRNSLTHGIY